MELEALGGTCEYISQARMLAIEEKYDKAFEVLLAAFKEIPSLMPIYEEEFCSVLLLLNTKLGESSSNQLINIFNNFSKALKIFPKNPLLLNNIGKYYYKYGFHKEALEQFEKVLQMSPTYADVEKNVNSLKNLLVERWHYRMLNDNLRNESYRQAIHQIVSIEDKVLDVGTGTGLLGIYAHEAGASKVIGCDGSKVMCDLADKIIENNSIKNMIVLQKMSTDLTPLQLGGKCSKLVTEMFDAGLFGEQVLQMLSHAWATLLSHEAVVVPNTAEFFVIGTQCDHLSKNYKLTPEVKSLLDIPSLNVHVCLENESYDSEDVHLMKDIQYLTEPKSVLTIDFNDPPNITKNLKKVDSYDVELVAMNNGQLNIVIGWFNLYLTESITITTDPRALDRANAWQQAIFFDDIPRAVKENDLINLKFFMNGGQLTMAPRFNEPIVRVSSEMIRFLNDSEYINTISNCVSIAYTHLAQIAEISETNIVDLCPFPLFGFLMLKSGAKSLTCYATNGLDKDFIIKVFLQNKIPLSKVSVVVDEDLSMEIFKENYYHAVFNHSLELCGDFCIEREQVMQTLRCNKLVQGGLFLPQQVMLVTQLVSSHWLDLNNRLYDKNVSNYIMATHFNRYKVSQNFDIDFSTLKYVPISEPILLCDCTSSRRLEEKSVKVISDGYANAILCWFSIGVLEQSQKLSTNRANSFMNGMLFLTYSKEELIAGNSVKISQHKDKDGIFKVSFQS